MWVYYGCSPLVSCASLFLLDQWVTEGILFLRRWLNHKQIWQCLVVRICYHCIGQREFCSWVQSPGAKNGHFFHGSGKKCRGMWPRSWIQARWKVWASCSRWHCRTNIWTALANLAKECVNGVQVNFHQRETLPICFTFSSTLDTEFLRIFHSNKQQPGSIHTNYG